MQEKYFYLYFSLAPSIGPRRFQVLIKLFGTAKKAWEGGSEQFRKAGIGEKSFAKFDRFRKTFDQTAYLEKLKKAKVDFVSFADKDYPELLRKIKSPPIVLFTKGDERLLDRQIIGVVGTRRMTSYGREVTESLVANLVLNEFVTASGMALGIDAIAHKTAIDNGGKTIAVLGCGVDCPYPLENEKLYEEILDSQGLIISEYPPGARPSRGTFPQRNRIIAGLSVGVLITEGAEDSGSLITANYAFENHRKVFAVPGPITSSLSKGPYKLIEKGAKLVTKAEDILGELKFQITSTKKQIHSKGEKTKFKTDSKEEQKILELLENEGLTFDEIARKTKINPSKLGSILSMMEIKGLVKSVETGEFVIIL